MAATFVNLETKKAFRIVSKEKSREIASVYAPDIIDKAQQQLKAYKKMDINELFIIKEVLVDIPAWDMPGPTRFKAVCSKCNIIVRDKREVIKNNKIFCRSCAFGAYYKIINKKK